MSLRREVVIVVWVCEYHIRSDFPWLEAAVVELAAYELRLGMALSPQIPADGCRICAVVRLLITSAMSAALPTCR